MSPRAPTPEQRAAADPAGSAWVGANAGSGKTRVLTERVARLLLAGAHPARILCLTYTKAAAAEMQTRLFGLLGRWAMAADAALAAEIAALTGEAPPGPEGLADARRLFAAALETPGGLKIQTIHAFCADVLRRFPVEAGVSPRMRQMEDRESALVLARIAADMAAAAEAGRDPAFDGVAERESDMAVDALLRAVVHRRDAWAGDGDQGAAIRRIWGTAAEGAGPAGAAALARLDALDPAGAAAALSAGGKTDRQVAEALSAALAQPGGDPAATAADAAAALLTQKGEPRKRFPTQAAQKAAPGVVAAYDALAAWAQETREALAAAEMAARTRALDRFARALLTRYAAAKTARSGIDFADLVERVRALVADPSVAQWVLWKLDRGIDHVLVDEAQDTAPAQWDIVEALTGDFFAGEGARGTGRTLFVVGDEKQSIYSFQGAEPRAFGERRAVFAERIEGAGGRLATPALETSFRSAPGILAFVDRVFADAAGALSPAGGRVAHRASRQGDGARIDLWPRLEPPEKEEPPPWDEPAAGTPREKPKRRLGQTLGREIARMIAEDRLPARADGAARRVRPGDILVLVRGRDLLAKTVIDTLKAEGVPVAGADRLTLAAGLAVKDLMALLKVAATPSDDLSLAAVLRSPLADLPEDDLFALAHGRERQTLMEALRAAGREGRHTEAAAMVADIAGRADYLRPYELLERVLIRHDGRRRLVARLGIEAEDLIDELLEQALSFEASEPPTLAGFVAWIEAGELQIKRDMEAGGGMVRVMTVHGAKGLEAPVVILPDTVRRPPAGRVSLPDAAPGGPPVWLGPKAEDDAVAAAARARAEAAQAEEELRLLYVALTRAQDWLVLCGAGAGKTAEAGWYGRLAAAMEGAAPLATPLGEGLRLEDGPEPVPHDEEAAGAATLAPLPAWAVPAAPEERPGRPSPSSLLPHEEAGGAGAGRQAALAHGNAVHLLLERLADTAAERRPALAERLLAADPGLDGAARARALAEAEAVLAAPFAAEIFAPGSAAEVPVALSLDGLARGPMIGRIDRLAVTETRVLAVDFKTDAAPPADPEGVPPAYLAQLAAYRAGLAQLFPGREIDCAVLWTAAPRLMVLPVAVMDAALARAVARA